MTSEPAPAQAVRAAVPDISWRSAAAAPTRFTPADRRRALVAIALRLSLVCAGLLGVAALIL